MRLVLIMLSVLLIGLLGCASRVEDQFSVRTNENRFRRNLEQAVEYLRSRYDQELQLIPDAQGPGGFEARGRFWTFDQVYHLADNRLASMALEPYDPELARAIAAQVERLYLGDSDGKANVVAGMSITQTVWITDGVIVDEGEEYIIFRGEITENVLVPLEGYMDVVTMYALFAWMNGKQDCARNLLNTVKDMWDGYGLVDGPGRNVGQYAIYKMALFLFALQVTGESFEHFQDVELSIWRNQESSGGIVTGITFDGRAVVGPNTETTALVILAYDHERIERLKQGFPLDQRTDVEVCRRL